jgi:hypothetical protein
VPHFDAPLASRMCGTFFTFMYGRSRCWWRAHRADDGDDLVVFDQLARLLDRLGRLVAVVERDSLILRPFTPPAR